jgi:hypothetical protein
MPMPWKVKWLMICGRCLLIKKCCLLSNRKPG